MAKRQFEVPRAAFLPLEDNRRVESYRIAWGAAPSPAEQNSYDWIAAGARDDWRGRVRATDFSAAVTAVIHEISVAVEWLLPVTLVSPLPSDHGIWPTLQALHIPGVDIGRAKPIDTNLVHRVKEQLPDAFSVERDPVDAPPLVVATDGSTKGRFTGWGWLAVNGEYGLHGFGHHRQVVGPSAAAGAELRAIGDAVQHLRFGRLRVLTDSQTAIFFAEAWRTGSERLPDGYSVYRASGRLAGLVRIQRLIYDNRDRLELQWVEGHGGHPLNEAADALARLARRYAEGKSGLSADDYRARAAGLATAFLSSFNGA